LSIESCLT